MSQYDYNSIVTSAYERLDEYVDCFARTAHVISDLMYGEMPQETPYVSVLIPTCGREELFRQALESALTQRDPGFPWEIVVTDNTPLDEDGGAPGLEAVRAAGSARVRYYHNRENIGSGYNWNRAVELARGEWVCFLHDDDLLFPDALQNLGRIIRGEDRWKKPLGYVQARRVEFRDAVPWQPKDRSGLEELTRFGALITGYTGTENPSCGTAVLREAYLRSGGVNYDFGPSADAVLGYRLMGGWTALLSDAYLGAYRMQENESLKADTARRLIEADALFARYRYRQSTFSGLWGRLFDVAQVRDNIRLKCRIARQSGIKLTVSSLQPDAVRGSCSDLRWFVYKCLVKAYRGARQVKVLTGRSL